MNTEEIWNLNKIQLSEGLSMLRRSRNMTLGELSEDSGMALTYLSKVENGMLVPKMETLSRMIAAYGLTIQQFYIWLNSVTELRD